MRSSLLLAAILLLSACPPALLGQTPAQAPPVAAPQTPAPTPPAAAPQPPAQPSPNALRMIVLDPAHGGTDTGARGSGGVIERDAVLAIAKALRAELEKQGGLQVLLTRESNQNPSFDDRAMLANAQRGAVFITLHVSSTGRVGTIRAYYFAAGRAGETKAERALVPWEEAQLPYTERSRRLAELLQVQLGQKFRGSPEVPAAAAVRQLRSITAPAIAVEISSVAAPNGKALEALAPELAAAIARAIVAFRPLYEAGGN